MRGFLAVSAAAVICPDCGRLIGAAEETCPFCGLRRPGRRRAEPLFRLLLGGGLHRLVIIACAGLYLASLLLQPSAVGGGGMLRFLSPGNQSLLVLGGSGAVPVFGLDRWWTVLSAGWLHGGLIHILFNMLWIWQLAPPVEALFGRGRATLLYVASGATGFALSSLVGAYLGFLPPLLQGAQLTIGASAAIFGLLGALVSYGRHRGASELGQQAWTWALVLFIFGFVMPGIDNWGHLGGFLGGYLGAAILDPREPERRRDRVMAVAALAASAAAVIWSVADAVLMSR